MEKTAQLQIRVSLSEKAEIRARANAAGLSISKWLLGKVLPDVELKFHELVGNLVNGKRTLTLAELNDFLTSLDVNEFTRAVSASPTNKLGEFEMNYLAAMIEEAASKKKALPPEWTKGIEPLKEPYFGSNLESLKLYLLTNSPAVFRRRNIFIDSTVGDRV